MRGISPLVSHSIFIAVGVVVLILMSALAWYFYDTYIKESIRSELNKNLHMLAGEIAELYRLRSSPVAPAANRSVMLGDTVLEFPEKVAGRNYIIELQHAGGIWVSNLSEGNISYDSVTLIGKTYTPEVTVNYTLFNIDASVQGYTRGGKTSLRYFRINTNGTIRDIIALGDSLVVFAGVE